MKPERGRTACGLLREVKVPWKVEFLASLLERQEPVWKYHLDPFNQGTGLPEKVCDDAAGTLAKRLADWKFVQKGGVADLDKQIAIILVQVQQKK